MSELRSQSRASVAQSEETSMTEDVPDEKTAEVDE